MFLEITRGVNMRLFPVWAVLAFALSSSVNSETPPRDPRAEIIRAVVDGNWPLVERIGTPLLTDSDPAKADVRDVAREYLVERRTMYEPIAKGNAASRNDITAARQFYGEAIKAAGDDPIAQVSLARAEIDRGNFAE